MIKEIHHCWSVSLSKLAITNVSMPVSWSVGIGFNLLPVWDTHTFSSVFNCFCFPNNNNVASYWRDAADSNWTSGQTIDLRPTKPSEMSHSCTCNSFSKEIDIFFACGSHYHHWKGGKNQVFLNLLYRTLLQNLMYFATLCTLCISMTSELLHKLVLYAGLWMEDFLFLLAFLCNAYIWGTLPQVCLVSPNLWFKKEWIIDAGYWNDLSCTFPPHNRKPFECILGWV